MREMPGPCTLKLRLRMQGEGIDMLEDMGVLSRQDPSRADPMDKVNCSDIAPLIMCLR